MENHSFVDAAVFLHVGEPEAVKFIKTAFEECCTQNAPEEITSIADVGNLMTISEHIEVNYPKENLCVCSMWVGNNCYLYITFHANAERLDVAIRFIGEGGDADINAFARNVVDTAAHEIGQWANFRSFYLPW